VAQAAADARRQRRCQRSGRHGGSWLLWALRKSWLPAAAAAAPAPLPSCRAAPCRRFQITNPAPATPRRPAYPSSRRGHHRRHPGNRDLRRQCWRRPDQAGHRHADISGANTYAGSTNVNVGGLKMGSDTALGSTSSGTTVAAAPSWTWGAFPPRATWPSRSASPAPARIPTGPSSTAARHWSTGHHEPHLDRRRHHRGANRYDLMTSIACSGGTFTLTRNGGNEIGLYASSVTIGRS